MAEGQVLEEVDVHLLGVLTRPRQPVANRHFGMAEEPLSIRDGQTEIDREQDLGHLRGRRAQAIERRAQATRKAFATRLAEQLLRPLGTALARAHQGVEGSIRVAVIITVRVGARMTGRANRLAPAPRTFPFAPREHAGLARVAPQRRGMRPPTHRAIVRGAWLEWTRCFALGFRSKRGYRPTSGTPKSATDQNDHPQPTEPCEILNEHPAPR